MSGISYKAAGSLENKKKYNGIEFDNDLDINTYEAYYRNLDPQIGRWWEIDPEIENGMENVSPYSSMYDDPILKSDFLGNIPEDCHCCPGAAELLQSAEQTAPQYGPAAEVVVAGGLIAAGLYAIGEFFSDHPGALSGGNANAKYYGTLQTAQQEIAAGQKVFTEKPISNSKPAATNSQQQQQKPKPSSPGKMQTEVDRKQAPRDIYKAHKAHNPNEGGKPHVHYKNGTASHNDGTVHDRHRGHPTPSRDAVKWLNKHGWTPPPPPTK